MSDPDDRGVPRVLVVGAGPVGLALAVELGTRGVAVTVVEQDDGRVRFPAGEAIFSRTMEHLRRWGWSDRARRESAPPPDFPHRIVFTTSVTGHLLAEFDYGVTNATPGEYGALTPEGPAFLSKFSFVPLLERAARALPGVEIRTRTRLDGFDQHPDGVRARVRDLVTGRSEVLDGAYLVACDGGRSGVRRALGIELGGTFAQGRNFAVHFRAPALRALLETHTGAPAAQIHTLSSPRRPYVTVVDGVDQWRLSVYVQHEPTPEEIVAWVHEAVGASIEVEILAAQPWSGHRVVADRYRDGRVFLAGDAAHLLWPKGGFGANTGIGDAVDLGWKLAATLEGWAGTGLLDSYEAERRPIAVRNVGEAASNWTSDSELRPDPVLRRPDAEGEAARAETGRRIRELRGREFRSIGVQLGYRYAGSPVCVPDGTPEPADAPDDYRPSTWPGCRAPHAWLPDGTSTLDHFGHGFVLVVSGEADHAPLTGAATRLGLPWSLLRLDDRDAVDVFERALVLVRPDGHVAWRGDAPPEEPRKVLDHVRGASPTLPSEAAPAAFAAPAVAATG